MHITIVGGCVMQQKNLVPSQLYHQQLCAALASSGYRPSLSLVRYERLATCYGKVLAQETAIPSDWMIFHLRTEPILRLIKLIYRYHTPFSERLRIVVNLPHLAAAAHHEPLVDRSGQPQTDFLTPAHQNFFAELNGRLGKWLGNERAALSEYEALVNTLYAYCKSSGTRLLLVGPVARPASSFENQLAHRIDHQFDSWAKLHQVPYVRLLGEIGIGGLVFFEANRIHLSAAGHQRLAECLVNTIENQNT